MTNPEIAKAILDFFRDDSARWCQGHYAKHVQYDRVPCGWCIMGTAIELGISLDDRCRFDRQCSPRLDGMNRWNDRIETTFDDVCVLLGRIAAQKPYTGKR